MSWKGFFEGIQAITEAILAGPLDSIRALELENWFLANGLNGVFLLVGFSAFLYWMKQLKGYNDEGKEDRTATSHSYLG